MNYDTVELLPNPAFLMQSMRHIGYTLETALADIIDNSIAAEASVISVQYRWNDANPWIAIIDDGCGMSSEGIKEAMRFGLNNVYYQDEKNQIKGIIFLKDYFQ